MHQAVKDIFPSFSKEFEGRISHFYLDVKGLVTIGVGNLVDPVELALTLPLQRKDTGRPATRSEIMEEWSKVKANKALAQRGHLAAAKVTALALSDSAIDELVSRKFEEFARHIRRHYTEIDQYPADAQLALMSMAWAMGPDFPRSWPRFSVLVLNRDWASAAAGCKMREAGNPGLVPRNAENKKLFENAALVVRQGLDKSQLFGKHATTPAVPLPAKKPEQTKQGWFEFVLSCFFKTGKG